MKPGKFALTLTVAIFAITTTGCFRVSSETRALRDAALELVEADEKVELGIGFFTVRLARFGSQFLELPPEARLVMDAVSGAECSVHEIVGARPDGAEVLARADKSMQKRGYERIVGVVGEDELVAVYVPRATKTERNLEISVLVMDRKQLVCVKARGDLEPLIKLALQQAQQNLPPGKRAGAAI